MKYFIVIAVLLVGIESRAIVPSSLDEAIRYLERRVPEGSKETSTSSDPIDQNSSIPLTDPESIVIDRKSWEYLEELRPFIVTQGRKLEKLLTEFAERSSNTKDHDQRATYWLKQLKMILKELSMESAKKSKYSENKTNKIVDLQTISTQDKNTLKDTDGFGDLLDSAEEFDIYFLQDGQDVEKHVKSRYEDSSSSFSFIREKSGENNNVKTLKSGVEQLNDMLIDMQNQVFRIRKYFEKICRKHHSMSSVPESLEHIHDDSVGSNQPKKISIL